MSRVKKGTAAELIAKAKFLLEGFNIYNELNSDSKVDFLVEKDNQYYRIQVKCVDKSGTLPFRKLSHSKTTHKIHQYTCTDVDYFVGVDLRTYDLYVLPITKITKSSKKIKFLQEYKDNFELEPYCGNIVSASPQVGEAFGNGNTELGSFDPSVETLRETPKIRIADTPKYGYLIEAESGKILYTNDPNYGEDKVQTTN